MRLVKTKDQDDAKQTWYPDSFRDFCSAFGRVCLTPDAGPSVMTSIGRSEIREPAHVGKLGVGKVRRTFAEFEIGACRRGRL
ncbi:unnamed protein product [Protopolystoma xenopodis]|uniref:Uncharacterized protein n=1 Tax=Protopolystoma xenopodis TaxID=117903 RepID=A0A448WKD3_9PLAT|nr:unnamed protein product [Protopolystoma xenopodis]